MSISKSDLNKSLELCKENPQFEKNYFKNYGSYKTYYKAQVIKNTNLGVLLLKSYKTDIVIYNPYTNVLYYNLNWYNSSKTTKEQLQHFLRYYVDIYSKDYKVVFLNDTDWYYMSKRFYHRTDLDNFLELEKELLSRWSDLSCIYIDIVVNKYISDKLKLYDVKRVDLKTRCKIYRYFEYDGLKVVKIDTYNKKHDLISSKIDIENKSCLIFDNRNWNEKKLFNGYDMGVMNNKKLSRREF